MDNNSNIPKNNPFKVPEKYFEELNDRIISTTAGTRKIEPARTVRFSLLLAAAASLAVLIVAGYIAMRIFTADNTGGKMAEQSVSINELILYDIDLLTIEESTTVSGIITEMPDMENNEIIDYLLQEDIDIALIYEQL